MKLYYAPGVCSLSPHIVVREAGLDVALEKVDHRAKKTQDGGDYLAINSKGQVPFLDLGNGQTLTEGPAIVQYLADQKPDSGLVPAAGTLERYKVQGWLNFVSSELHKSFGPMFNPAAPEGTKPFQIGNIEKKLGWLNGELAGKQYLMGDKFTVADAYLFTVLRWAGRVDMDISKWPNVKAYFDRVQARPKVQEALKHEGLIQ